MIHQRPLLCIFFIFALQQLLIKDQVYLGESDCLYAMAAVTLENKIK